MELKDVINVGSVIIVFISIFVLMFVLFFVVFPFIQSFSPEKRFERFVDEKCLEGNEVAIRMRRNRLRYYSDRDFNLYREAINGNENAVKALNLDKE